MMRAYKRICFQGRGLAARWLDRVFFALLGGAALYILIGRMYLGLLFMAAVLFALILLDLRRWERFQQRLWRTAADQLKREAWLRTEGERIGQAGEIILYPAPDKDALVGLCLRLGPGRTFRCFGTAKAELNDVAQAFGCRLTFHPFGKGQEPSREEVLKRLERDAPKQKPRVWRRLLTLPGSRYLVAGCLLLLLSIFLRRALYWRLLGTLCLVIAALRRAFHGAAQT